MADSEAQAQEGAGTAVIALPAKRRGASGGNPIALLLQRLQGLVTAKDASVQSGLTLAELLEGELQSNRLFTKDERRMLANLLQFGALRVDDVMVPRADIKAVEITASVDEVLDLFADAAHSRLPVYRGTLDDPVGMVHIKDVVTFIAEANRAEGLEARKAKFALSKLRRDVLFVPRSMPALDLLVRMQTSRVHLALVVDEYGGTDGLLSIEDLVEAIVGDIEDEHDSDGTPLVLRHPDGTLEADARADIEDLEEALALSLVPESREEEFDTLGGLVVAIAGRVPTRGEIILLPGGTEVEVLDADPRRLKRLKLRLPHTEPAAIRTQAEPA